MVCGFEWGIDARSIWEAERRLDIIESELCGSAYDGVTMALTVLDAMGPGRGTRTRNLLTGPGQPHIFLAYVITIGQPGRRTAKSRAEQSRRC